MSKKWMKYIIIGSVNNGIIGIALKMCRSFVSEYAMVDFLFLGFGQAAVISFIIGVVILLKVKPDVSHFGVTAFALVVLGTAVSTAAGNYIMVFLSLHVSALVQFPVISGSLVLTSIVTSRFLFKEQVTKQHYITIGVGLVSIVMLSI